MPAARSARNPYPGRTAMPHTNTCSSPPALGERHRPSQQKCEHGQHQDAGEHGIDVEGAFSLQDQISDATRRAEVFTDNGADESQAYRIVQAGEHPAHRAWHIDMAQEL